MSVKIIAEAGVNHNGSLEKAIELIRVAAECGADYVKFQTFSASNLVTKKAAKAAYQIESTTDTELSQYEMLKKLEIPIEWYPVMLSECKKQRIKFLSTAFDLKSIDFLDSLNPDFFKVPSGEITNKPYLIHIAQKGKPVVISTGMSEIHEINQAILTILEGGVRRENITVLHCNSAYPTPFGDVNLKVIPSLKEQFGTSVGYSDHTLGIEVSVAAVALGATTIEKHFTLDNKLPGPDHKASLCPEDLGRMVLAIRNIEEALDGNGEKTISQSESVNRDLVRKSIHLSAFCKKDTKLDTSHLVMKRPGNGISPMEIDKVLGKRLTKDFPEDYMIQWEDFQ